MSGSRERFDSTILLWLTLLLLGVFVVAFVFYVKAEKQIDRAHEMRENSFRLADELRQSSDDLTRLVRTYVVTGNPLYKKAFQEMLDIREGRQPRPLDLQTLHWDPVAIRNQSSRPAGEAVPLLELMRRTGATENEMSLLTKAKTASDQLAKIELQAMDLIESAAADRPAIRETAIRMLYDEDYHRAKENIMASINACISASEQRTSRMVENAEQHADRLRIVVIVCGVFPLIFLLLIRRHTRNLLGGSVDAVHYHITELGRGEFSTPVPVGADQQESVLGRIADTKQKLAQMEEARCQAEAELSIAAAAFDSQEGVMVTNVQGIILRVNRAFTEISGYAPEEVIGRTPRLLQSGRHDEAFYQAMWRTIDETGKWQGEIWDKHKSGRIYPKWLTISAVHGSQGQVTHYVGTHYDITERKLAEERIHVLAFYDQLTGLPNRTLLLDRLERAMASGARSGQYGALMFLDLDNFKTLNDTQGHELGDLLLKEAAHRLRQCVREEDTAARQGGDEFVVVLSGLGSEQAEAASAAELVAEKILGALSRTYELGQAIHRCSASIGVTLFGGREMRMEELLKQADLAMYKSKATGRNRVRFFDPTMEVAVQEHARLEDDLRIAVETQQFFLHYQPQVIGTGRIIGAEVLVRWRHPQRGMVSPADFIPLAEETDLILPLGDWVMRTACQRLAQWASSPGLEDLTVAVNVSVKQFLHSDFADRVLAIIRETAANPQRLKLELTESLLAKDIERIIATMSELKAHGIGFSLDDFGTGYSSLSYLKRLPLDQLKIDQSFVRDVLTDPNDAAIARTIVALGQTLGLSVIAEGVETEAQREFLANSGCQTYQGYLFSHPVSVEEFEQQLGSDLIAKCSDDTDRDLSDNKLASLECPPSGR